MLEPQGVAVDQADRTRDYEVSGSSVRLCALGSDGAWVTASSDDEVLATGPSGEECTTS